MGAIAKKLSGNLNDNLKDFFGGQIKIKLTISMKRLLPILLFVSYLSYGQTVTEHKAMYRKALQEQLSMLQGKKPIDFKKSVFLVENAYNKNKLSYAEFC